MDDFVTDCMTERRCFACGNVETFMIDGDECYCNEDQGAGYTYDDEHGPCGYCLKTLVCSKCGSQM